MYLEYALGKARLLGQLFEIFGVRILIDGKVGLHGSQLVVFEGRPHPLGPLLLLLLRSRSASTASAGASVRA